MKKTMVLSLALVFMFSISAFAGDDSIPQISNLLNHKSELNLSDSQVKKLELIQKVALQNIREAKVQANIRKSEIEKFSSQWIHMNGSAMRGLVEEYYDYMAEIKIIEVNAIIQAKAVLKNEQLDKCQQVVSSEAMIINVTTEFTMK